MSRTVFLTGATGFLGSRLAYELLGRGDHVVALVRPRENLSLADRMRHPFAVIDPEFVVDPYLQSGQLRLVAGDITIPGITDEEVGKVDVFINSAASIKFSNRDYEETWRTNVLGTKHSLDLADRTEATLFCQVSTAYVRGATSDKFTEWDKGTGPFSNIYERTKAQGEFEVVNRCEEIDLDYAIFRSGVIVGDSENGRALAFDGYYGYFAAFHTIRQILVRRNGDGDIPLATRSERSATLSLVPVDWLARMILTLVESPKSTGRTFHLTHANPPHIRWLIETSLGIMGIKGVKLLDPEEEIDHNDKFLNRLQARLDQGIRQYEPYTCTVDRFDQTMAILVANSHWEPTPEIDEAYLRKILSYAMERDFRSGRK